MPDKTARDDFSTFWESYPRKESPRAAEREYWHARRRTPAEDILAGLERYNAHLPRDVQYIKKAANWLIDGDWENEYDMPIVVQQPADANWFEECRDLHGGTCGGRLRHHTTMAMERQKAKGA